MKKQKLNWEQNEVKKQKYNLNWSAVIVLVVVLALFSVFIVRPSYLGYTVYQKLQKSNYTLNEFGKNVEQLSSDLEKTKVNLTGISDINGQLRDENRQINGKLNKCEVEKAKTAAELEQAEADIVELQQAHRKELKEKEDEHTLREKNLQDAHAQVLTELRRELETVNEACQQNLTSAQNEYAALQERYDFFVKNIARSVCCKEKVDNANIKFYKVVDDKLACLEDSGEALAC